MRSSEELACELSVTPERLRAWLAEHWPDADPQHATAEQEAAARDHWAPTEWQPAWPPGKEPYRVEVMGSWSEYREWVDERLANWVFRGQADARWPLWSSLSRTLRRLGIARRLWPWQELRILRVFKRKAHLFLEHVPEDRDELQWLAIMQHHGAPTRLLDLTWSPYTAAFFALERAAGDAAVWCIHYESTRGPIPGLTLGDDRSGSSYPTVHDVLPKWYPGVPGDEWRTRTQENFRRYFVCGSAPFVYLGEPHVMNQRLIAQNATFAMPSRLDVPVDEILGGHDPWARGLVKLVLPRELRHDAMQNLFSMNVTSATLFPDLNGLAQSMAQELEYHWAYNVLTGDVLDRLDDPRAGWDES